MPRNPLFSTRAPRWVAFFVIGAALFIRWPVLDTGFSVDDYAQLAMMRGYYPVARAPLTLFTFSDGTQRENQQLRATGFFPWWSHPELRVSLLRPLSSALMWFDLWAFERNEYAYHLHSACWWLAMMLSVYWLLRKAVSGWAAVLALAIFSAHPAHNLLLGWIANRNAIVATTFAVLGLNAQLRAANTGRRADFMVTFGLYALALAAGEYAVGYLVYGVCLSLLRTAAPALRVRRLLIWGGLFGTYVAVRAALGFGTRASGMYIDPAQEPLAFAQAAMQRLPVLAGDAVFAVRSTWWSGGFPWLSQLIDAGIISRTNIDLAPFRHVQWVVGLVACAVAFWVVRRGLQSSAQQPTLLLRALGYGFPLALLPALASLPESRLMLPALLGWSALLAYAFVVSLNRWRTAPRTTTALAAAGLLALCLLECTWPLSYATAENRDFPTVARAVRGSMLTPEMDALAGPGKLVLLAAAVDPTTTIYMPLLRRWYDHAGPESCQLLMGGYGRLKLTRIAANDFVLQRMQTQFTGFDVYASAFNRLPLNAGDHFESGPMTVTVLHSIEGRPVSARYHLDRSLDSESVVLVEQTGSGFQQRAFPPLGESIWIEPAELPLNVAREH